MRHWHEQEDEFVYILARRVRAGRGRRRDHPEGRRLRGLQGQCAERPLHREPVERDVLLLEVGTRAPSERAHYPDVDLKFERDGTTIRVLHKDGTPY